MLPPTRQARDDVGGGQSIDQAQHGSHPVHHLQLFFHRCTPSLATLPHAMFTKGRGDEKAGDFSGTLPRPFPTDAQGHGCRRSSCCRSASASRPSSSSASSAHDGSLCTCRAPSSRVCALACALTPDFSPAAAHVPDVQQRGWRRLFGWIIPTLRTSDYVVLQTVGLDAAVVRHVAGALTTAPQLLLHGLLPLWHVLPALLLRGRRDPHPRARREHARSASNSRAWKIPRTRQPSTTLGPSLMAHT